MNDKNIMKSYFLRKANNTITRSLRREKTIQSEDDLRRTNIPERRESSERRSMLSSKHRQYSKSATKTSLLPYDNFVKELKIRLPTPKQKFYQFLSIPPFNRTASHNELITLFLKHLKFFKVHQTSLIISMAKKVRLVELEELDEKMMVVVLEGECFYEGKPYRAGQLINRKPLKTSDISADYHTKLISINIHDYSSFVVSFVSQESYRFKDFLNGIQLFKMFNEKTIQKFTENMTLKYFLKGQSLYKIGDAADVIYVIFSGKASRQVVVQIEKVNKIPYRRFQREVRILSKSYSHHIEFFKEDILGVNELIDGMDYRKEEIDIDEDSIIIAIDRSVVQDYLDDYARDRLKKYILKKYPSNYDDLCSNYERDKSQLKKSEERKISAMQNELRVLQNDKRKQKIESIIKIYQQNIKSVESKNLISKRLHCEVDYTK